MTNKNLCFFVFVHKKHSSYCLRKSNSVLEIRHVGRVKFYWRRSKAVTVIWADSRVELLSWIMIKEEATSSRTKTLARIFLLSVVTECILVTVEMKMYINVHKPSSCIVFFFLCFSVLVICWGSSQCAVCYGFSRQCCNENNNQKKRKTNKKNTCKSVCPEDAQSKTNCHCVVFNMDMNVSLIPGERLLKRSMMPFVTVVLFLLNMDIVSRTVGIQKTT